MIVFKTKVKIGKFLDCYCCVVCYELCSLVVFDHTHVIVTCTTLYIMCLTVASCSSNTSILNSQLT